MKGKISIRNKICPECKIKSENCDCNFNCPSCLRLGSYDTENNIICPFDSCRVRRFFTQ